MYLKRLEIQGFKSFASRTVFEFGPGITAIVGPNGSGKSNVAEALRWVLGEQSARQLRLRRLEDVIFSGGAQRPATGMAEVSLTLDNSQGRLPIAAAEIVVGRRVYRSGEGEYLINGRRCRLRDVAELLQRGGLVQNGYWVIGQGMVDATLNLRPEERRLLIEEAANLQRYHGCLLEALSRITNARENMGRLQLLMDELEPRVAHLQSQASRAAEYARVSDELSRTLRLWYVQRWQAATEALARAKARYQERLAERDQAVSAVASLEKELMVALQRTAQLRSSLDAEKEKADSIRQAIRNLEGDVAVGRQKRDLVARRREELGEEIARLSQEKAEQAEHLRDAQAQLAKLQEELKASREELEAAEVEVARVKARLNALRSEASVSAAKAARSRASALEVEGRWRWCQERRQQLERDVAQLRQRRQALVSRLVELARQMRRLKEHHHAILDTLAATLGQRAAVEGRLEEGTVALRSLEEERGRLTRQRSDLERRLASLQQAKSSLPLPAKEVMEAARARTLVGLLDIISRVIQVPSSLAQAIEAALAAHLQAIVVQRTQDALAAIQLLRERKAGRAVFLPLEGVRHESPISLKPEPGIVGVAAQLVKCSDAYRPLIDTLLGKTIVVADVKTAYRVLQQEPVSAVTLDGTLLYPWGAIAGGDGTGRSTLVSYEQEEELSQQRADLDSRLASLDDAASALAAFRGESSRELQRLTAEVASLRKRVGEAEKALLTHRHQLASLREEIRGLLARERQALDEDGRLEAEVRGLADKKESLAREAKDAEAAAAKAGAALTWEEEENRNLLATVARHNAKVTSVESTWRSLQQLQASRQKTVARLDEQLANRQQQLQQLQGEEAVIEKTLQQQEAQLAQAKEQLLQHTGKNNLQQELGELVNRERGLQEQLLAARKEETAAEHRLLQAEAQVQRQEDTLANLVQSMETDGISWEEDCEGPLTDIDSAFSQQDLAKVVQRLRGNLKTLGTINPEAGSEYRQIKQRYDFLSSQLADLQEGEASLRQAIADLQQYMEVKFQSTFQEVDREFAQQFQALFRGGQARLTLVGNNGNRAGVDILAQPPGKRHRSLSLLSSGERALTTIALLLALLRVNPTPFCLLDEVDASLDEANVERFAETLSKLRSHTQFIVITHSRRTIEAADFIYGISMGQDAASRVLSLRLSDVPAEVPA